MDFDTAKENIQPLRQGRRADRLEAALGEHSKETLEAERKQYEEAIIKYEGHDPLSAWYEYICWIEQSFAKGGTESGLDEAVLNCIVKFENDLRYRQDRRMIKLYIKYIDTQEDPNECYSQLYANGIGTLVADLYIAWSYYFDVTNNFQQAEAVFRRGLDAKAQPLEDLAQAHTAFSISMSRRLLYKDESSQEQFRTSMEEKRSALTSLRAHKKKHVGSVRTGIAVKNDNPGIVNQENVPSSSNTKVEVHEDAATGPALPLPSETSVIRSIIDSARKKENAHEAGPWAKGKVRQTGSLFSKLETCALNFDIMEDESLPPIPCPDKLYEKGILLPEGFVTRNNPQTQWDIPMIISEPTIPRTVPCYEKFLLYPNESTEISPEEYRGYKWFKKQSMTTRLTEQYDSLWENTFESGIRLIPGFVKKNVQQVETCEFERFVPGDDIQGFVVNIAVIYPDGGAEMSLEELLAEKYKRGEIILAQDADFEEIDDMELTQIGDRRQSIYPTSRLSSLPRKSIVVRKSIMPPPTVDEDDETEEEAPVAAPAVVQPSTGAIRKSIMKRKLDDSDYKSPVDECAPKKDYVTTTPTPSAFCSRLFKPPAPVEKKQVGFSMEEDEDTCSTQQFNFFLRAQSVSTPVAKKKSNALVATEAMTEAKASPTEDNEVASPGSDLDLAVVTPPPNADVPKQLSTIMETTETTHSTKSSVSHASSENDTELNTKTPKSHKSFQSHRGHEQEQRLLTDPLMMTLRMPDEQTETCANYVLPRIQQIHQSLSENYGSAMKLPATPQLKITQNCSIAAPPVQFDATFKSPVSENSTKTDHEVTQIENKTLQGQTDDKATLKEDKETIPDDSVSKSTTESDKALLKPESPHPKKEQEDLIVFQDNESIFETQAKQNEDAQTDVSAKIFKPLLEHEELTSSKSNQLVEDLKTIHVEESVIEIPSTGDEDSLIDIPATQGENSLEEIPATQEEPDEEVKVQAAVKNASVLFNIYEDSVMEEPKPKSPTFKVPETSDNSFLHASRKENAVVFQAPKAIRTMSDEFLDLMISPKKGALGVFGNINTKPVLDPAKEVAMIMERPSDGTKRKVSSPFDFDDLNTQNFQKALGSFNKNSTLLGATRPTPTLNQLDLSVELEADELVKFGKAKNQTIDEVKVTETLSETENARPCIPTKTEFKVPMVPAPFVAKAINFDIFEDSEDDDNMGKSIYVPQKESKEVDDQEWEPDCSFLPTVDNQYEHTIIEDVSERSIRVQRAIAESNGNPFLLSLREAMLDHCNFSLWLSENVKTCELLGKIPPLRKRLSIQVAETNFSVVEFIAKGSFGSIYSAKNMTTNEIVAIKQEKPPSLWEYYICVELKDRLKDERMLPAFMSIDHAIIAKNASVLISKFSPYGTIISVSNKHKNVTNRNIDEYVVMVLTTQLLSIVDHLHSCKIIHADVKPDNFLVMSKIEYGMKVPAIQLIDFGNAIDMDWYGPGTVFTEKVTTENFVCCEMLENKPWTYQTDLFGLVGTVHTMLFGRYMEVEKKFHEWNIKSRYQRYLKKFLWENLFTTLLNVPNCNEMPNLQSLKDQFEEFIQENQKPVCEKIFDFNRVLS